jgi:hypothetical protein
MDPRMTSIDCLRGERCRVVTMSAVDAWWRASANRRKNSISSSTNPGAGSPRSTRSRTVVFAEAAPTLTANDESRLHQAFEALDSTRAALLEVARWEWLAEQVQPTGVSR